MTPATVEAFPASRPVAARDAGPPEIETRFLNPGEWAAGKAGDVFGTLLGSCVAITMWHPLMLRGAICHYVLPAPAPHGESRAADARYGVDAFRLMRKWLADNGIDIRQCAVKMFGGARLAVTDEGVPEDVGARNLACGRRMVESAGLAPPTGSTGGRGWRRLSFDIATGNVWVRFHSIEGHCT